VAQAEASGVAQERHVLVGNWEPHPWEIRKNFQDWGFARTGEESLALHQADRSEETVERLRKMGVNMVLTSFHKGFGIANEKETMEEARQFGERLHKRGMKMAVLVSTLLIYEDLYGEIPESKNWHRFFSTARRIRTVTTAIAIARI